MKKKYIYIIIALVVLAVVFVFFKPFGKNEQKIEISTEKVSRGGINEIITATGTLEALETVEVGTQVSGIVESVFVDYNSVVKKGQLLAKIDETPLIATLEQSLSTVESAEAQVEYQKSEYERYKAMAEKKLIAQADYDLVVYNYKTAVASLKNAKLAYQKNKINLEYASIYSPIDGVILGREVDEGQTVAASFSTPTMFTIANDLTQMQVEADVDEADIGRLAQGQRVEFTVDAFPDLKFEGTVTEIRYQPVETSNVITYTVVIDAPNPDKKLLPGMTASVSFYVTEKKNILLVAAKALDLNPDPSLLMAYKEKHPEINLVMGPAGAEGGRPQPPAGGEMGGDFPNPADMQNQSDGEGTSKMVLLKEDNTIKTQLVKVGETNELYYEVLDGLKDGDEVIVSVEATGGNNASKASTATGSPFMPGGGRPGGPPR